MLLLESNGSEAEQFNWVRCLSAVQREQSVLIGYLCHSFQSVADSLLQASSSHSVLALLAYSACTPSTDNQKNGFTKNERARVLGKYKPAHLHSSQTASPMFKRLSVFTPKDVSLFLDFINWSFLLHYCRHQEDSPCNP